MNEKFNVDDYQDIKTIHDLTLDQNEFDKLYDEQLKKLLEKTNNHHYSFFFHRGDVISANDIHILTLCKNRSEFDPYNSTILRCFNFDRHWGNYYNKPDDIPFENKKNKVFWRGTSTGCSDNFKSVGWNPRSVNRFNLVKSWFNKYHNIDVGFSFLHKNWLKNKWGKYVKGKCKIKKFLENKYLLSVEGNDKDSGLNWKLNSNSLVLMPKPRINSWLMETTLIPNYHYILLEDDFSDLPKKLKWCNKNQDKCKAIVNNANNYMKQFSDKDNEEQLEIDVINKYFKLINPKRLNIKTRYQSLSERKNTSELTLPQIKNICLHLSDNKWNNYPLPIDPLTLGIFKSIIINEKFKTIFNFTNNHFIFGNWMNNICQNNRLSETRIISITNDDKFQIPDDLLNTRNISCWNYKNVINKIKKFVLFKNTRPWLIIQDNNIKDKDDIDSYMEKGDYIIISKTNPYYTDKIQKKNEQYKSLENLTKFIKKNNEYFLVDSRYCDQYGYNGSSLWNSILKKIK